MQSSREAISNGFLRRHSAPLEAASSSRCLSGKAVIRITGIESPRSRSSRSRSSPPIPGIWTSAMMQSMLDRSAEIRNVSAE